MPNHQTFADAVNDFFNGNYSTSQGTVIPNVDDIQFGKFGKEMELAMLFIDLRESTKIVDGFRRQTAAKMYKSFLWGIAKIARENGGELRSFNGDGVLVVFAGNERCNMAVKAAMFMSYFVNNILKPKIDGYLANNNQTANIKLKFGIGIDTGTVLIVRGGVQGENNNDLVWVGNATNYAVKLSNMKNGGAIRIMPSVYNALSDDNKFGNNGLGPRVNMWQSTPFPIELVSATPQVPNPNLNYLNFLSTPQQNQGLLGSILPSNLRQQFPAPSVPRTYYHTNWYRKFT